MEANRKKGGYEPGAEPWEWYRDCFIDTVRDLDDCDVFSELERKKWLDPFLYGFMDEFLKDCKLYEDVDKRWREWNLPAEDYAISLCRQELTNVPIV